MKSRNKREGKYAGKIYGKHRRAECKSWVKTYPSMYAAFSSHMEAKYGHLVDMKLGDK